MSDALASSTVTGARSRKHRFTHSADDAGPAPLLTGHPTYRRTGQITYQAFLNTGIYPVDTQGEYPFQQFDFYGRETDQDVEAAKGYASSVKIIQMVEKMKLDTEGGDLPNGDGRARRLPKDFLYTVAAEVCTLRPGNVKGVSPTEASASIDIFARDSFEYSGASDNEFYIMLINPYPAALDVQTYEQLGLGSFTLRVHNMTTQKDITRFKVPLDDPQGITVIDVEHVLSARHSAKVSATDQVGVELHHSAYAITHRKQGMVGAISGFTLVRTALA